MNTTVKIILGFVAGALVVCLLAGIAGLLLFRSASSTVVRTIQNDPAQAPAIIENIAEFDLPADFGEPYAKSLAGFNLLSYTGQDGHSHITFFQLPAGVHLDPEELERQFNQAIDTAPDPESRGRKSELIDQFPATIRGQETTLVLTEGLNSDGQTFRQFTAIFEGENGQTLVTFERPLATWDQAEAEAFFASIR